MNSYSGGSDITKSDTVDIVGGPCEAIYCGSVGNIVLDVQNPGGGDAVTLTFTGLVAGQILPVRAKRVRVASTVTGMIALR